MAARSPAAAVVLADGDLGVRRAVLPLDGAEGAPDRQLPADVGLGLERVAPLLQRQRVQRAARRRLAKSATVVEDAGRLAVVLDDPGLARALVVGLDPVGFRTRPAVTELPVVRVELLDVRRRPASRRPCRRSARPACSSRSSGAPRRCPGSPAEDAGPARGQPGQVAAEDLVGVGGVANSTKARGKRRATSGTQKAYAPSSSLLTASVRRPERPGASVAHAPRRPRHRLQHRPPARGGRPPRRRAACRRTPTRSRAAAGRAPRRGRRGRQGRHRRH